MALRKLRATAVWSVTLLLILHAAPFVAADASETANPPDASADAASSGDGLDEVGSGSLTGDVSSTQPYDLDSPANNVLLDLVIPALIPVLYETRGIGPGDASIILRWTMLVNAAWFDALAPYHTTAVGVFTDLGRRPSGESETSGDLSVALLFASHRLLTWLGPEQEEVWDQLLQDVGLDPTDMHEGSEDPIGIGNAAAAGVIAAREHDGFNQVGFEGGRTFNPQPYADYTEYEPRNTAYKLRDARMWQPQLITDSLNGISRVQAFVTPQWRLTQPFSYTTPKEFSAPKPEKSYDVSRKGRGKPGELYRQQADEVLAVSAALTDEQKLQAEFFDDKIFSLGFSILHSTTSRQLSLVDFVLMDYVTNLAAYDAGIVIWQEKTKWNAVRPFSAIAKLYRNTQVTAWGGVGKGAVDNITGREWSPYMQTADHPEYPSASAGFCAAHALTARNFVGDDSFGYEVIREAGSSLREPGVTPAATLTLSWPTWTEFEEDCGNSRVWGGVHFPDAVPAGQNIGKEVGERAWQFYQDHLNGVGVAGSLHGFTSRK